jgi:hypothetical protein
MVDQGKRYIVEKSELENNGKEAAISALMDLFDVTRGTAEHAVTRVAECLRQDSGQTNRQ